MTVVIGVGETEYVRGTVKSERDLCIEAAFTACRDGDIEPSSLDGIIIPGQRDFRLEDIAVALRISDLRFSCKVEIGGAAPVAAMVDADGAIRSGSARRVLLVGGWTGYSGRRLGAGGEDALSRLLRSLPSPMFRADLEHPYGLFVPMQYYSLQANRWIYEYEIDPDSMGLVATTMRRHAQFNQRAYMRGRVMSMDDYLASPVVCAPLRVLDCCLETDGAAAIIFGADDDTASRSRRVQLLAAAEGHPDSPDDIVGRPDLLQLGVTKAAPRLFEESGLGPSDIDFAELYDCFTFIVMRQLEEIGFCRRGESPRFIRERGIGIGQGLPINTHGGLLSQAHVLGLNHIVEAVRQLRGEAGEAQVKNARVGLVSGYGDLGDGAVALLANGAGPHG
jgi:acetyl-CoA acetyltransferase